MSSSHGENTSRSTRKSVVRHDHRNALIRRAVVRRRIGYAASLFAVVALAIGAWIWSPQAAFAEVGTIEVHKSATCACCARWVTRAREHGFVVAVHDETDMTAIKHANGVPAALQSCHTSVVAGYVFEGHVPSDLVERVLRERPAIAGLAVPGMPQGAPGMEMGAEHYDVLSFSKTGESAVYARR